MRTSRIVLIVFGIAAAGCARLAGGSSVPTGIDGGALQVQRGATKFKSLYVFDGQHGADPRAGLIVLDGVLYGTTVSGGKHGRGTVFSLTEGGKEKVVYSFTKLEYGPYAPVLALGGVLYGTTAWSDADPGGGTYALEPDRKLIWSHKFKGRYNGFDAEGGLTNLRGALYGTTSEGGDSREDGGAFYRVTTNGKERELYIFKGPPDGSDPRGDLLAVNGVLYGTTAAGGSSSRSIGTVFRITSSGQERVLYSFVGYSPGAEPVAGLVEMGGTLYGTTELGGTNYAGVVFSISTSGEERVIYNFGTGSGDGQRPMSALVEYHGNLYGTTFAGGAYDLGTVFEVTPSGEETVLHSFSGGTDGSYPMAGLVALHGRLYGTTAGGYASSSDGTVFAIAP
jgi:uncharacterized repeat protein (TIGR03803 family)